MMKNLNTKSILRFLLAVSFCSSIAGCKKYLDVKPNQSYAVPSKLADFQALLDNYAIMNNVDPGSGEISSDDYYLDDVTYNALSTQFYRDMYIWKKDNLFDQGSNEWSYTYNTIYIANEVLDGLKGLNSSNTPQTYNNIKGQALVFRAKSFLEVVAVWSLAFDSKTASTDLGIPLRLSSDFNLPSVRASVGATYSQIIIDLKQAIPLCRRA
jgi:hypothetical protein